MKVCCVITSLHYLLEQLRDFDNFLSLRVIWFEFRQNFFESAADSPDQKTYNLQILNSVP